MPNPTVIIEEQAQVALLLLDALLYTVENKIHIHMHKSLKRYYILYKNYFEIGFGDTKGFYEF